MGITRERYNELIAKGVTRKGIQKKCPFCGMDECEYTCQPGLTDPEELLEFILFDNKWGKNNDKVKK